MNTLTTRHRNAATNFGESVGMYVPPAVQLLQETPYSLVLPSFTGDQTYEAPHADDAIANRQTRRALQRLDPAKNAVLDELYDEIQQLTIWRAHCACMGRLSLNASEVQTYKPPVPVIPRNHTRLAQDR